MVESGPEPVFAQAAADRPSRFILRDDPAAWAYWKSSPALVNEEDKSKPRAQQYRFLSTRLSRLPRRANDFESMSRTDRQTAFSGTTRMRRARDVRHGAARSFSKTNIGGFGFAARAVQGGQSNPTHHLATPARSFVLRRKPPGNSCRLHTRSIANFA
jgi:hypothetical protein